MTWAQDKLQQLRGLASIARTVYNGLDEIGRVEFRDAVAKLRDEGAPPPPRTPMHDFCDRIVAEAPDGSSEAHANPGDWQSLTGWLGAKIEWRPIVEPDNIAKYGIDARWQYISLHHAKGTTILIADPDVTVGVLAWRKPR